MGKAKDIREAVKRELMRDPLVDAGDITVRNVDGSLALIGTVRSYPQFLEAAKVARRATGVTSVHNHLEVVLPPDDYRDDAMLTTAANNALAASAAVPEGVKAVANSGNLTLTGAVKYRSERAAAESAVSGLTGVRNIKDEIELAFDVDPGNVNQLIKEALDPRVASPGDADVVARASGNTVMLMGRVRTQAQHDAVVAAAWRGRAVMAVIDELQIIR